MEHEYTRCQNDRDGTHNFQWCPTQHGEPRLFCSHCGEVRTIDPTARPDLAAIDAGLGKMARVAGAQ